ncbi:MAG: methyltransferase domain-containing protein [Myxococcales bacterium]|nr:methyltransferase domain-containing protein [Myxococcales bacterium]
MAELVDRWIAPKSVVDFGCAHGAWLLPWKPRGASVFGVDGHWVDEDALLVDRSEFRKSHLGEPIDLGRRFDLVQSLEVAEHIEPDHADVFVDNLVRHGDRVLFSAAVCGQPGEHHVNLQPPTYWRDKFAARGFELYDVVRYALRFRDEVAPWYRHNALLFVHKSKIATLPVEVQEHYVGPRAPIADVSPLAQQAVFAVLHRLPRSVGHQLAVLDARIHAARQRVARALRR